MTLDTSLSTGKDIDLSSISFTITTPDGGTVNGTFSGDASACYCEGLFEASLPSGGGGGGKGGGGGGKGGGGGGKGGGGTGGGGSTGGGGTGGGTGTGS